MNRLSHTFAAFAVRDFRLMWFGSLFSVTAFMTSFILVPSVAYELTGSYLAAGLAQMGAGVAQLLLGPIGGVIADRYPKKPLVLVGQMLPGFLIAGMGILILTDRISIPLLILTTLLMGSRLLCDGPGATGLDRRDRAAPSARQRRRVATDVDEHGPGDRADADFDRA